MANDAMDTINQAEATPLEKALMAWAESTFKTLSKTRQREEKLWQLCGLFYQGKQWLDWNKEARRYTEQKPDLKRPRPMPVSNYLAKTIDAQANQLGAELPKVEGVTLDDDFNSRKAADMAIRAKDVIDRESGMIFLNSILAKHVPLFGLGCTKDYFDKSLSAGVTHAADVQTTQSFTIDCGACQQQSKSPEQVPDQTPCPLCGSTDTVVYPEAEIAGADVTTLAKGKITTDIVPIFEIYLPRNSKDPNLSRLVLQRGRRPVGEVQRQNPDKAEQIKADAKLDLNDQYLATLKSMSGFTMGTEGDEKNQVTVTELWAEYEEMPKKLRNMLEKEYASDPETLTKFKQGGIFVKCSPGLMLDWGANPMFEETTGDHYNPYTFFPWKKDPASPYPNPLTYELIPLQKMLNQVDSLLLLAHLSNAAGKWVWPKTQQSVPPPSGSPTDVVWWDNQGEGKNPPTFINPTPVSAQLFQFRMQILADMNALGLTEAVTMGQAPGNGVNAFRSLAYLGAKAAEQINTQRSLWETSHELRCRKVLLLAKLNWDEPRRARISGHGGKYRSLFLSKDDLHGNYEVEVKAGSSKPKLLSEKIQNFQMALAGKLIDPTSPATQSYALSMLGLDEVDASNHLHEEKAQRDLDRVKQGAKPILHPYIKWDVHLKVFAEYTLTEEFEDLDPMIQQEVLFWTQGFNEMVSQVKQDQGAGALIQQMLAGGKPGAPAPEAGPDPAAAMAQAPAPGSELNQVPGAGAPIPEVQNAAVRQGNNVAAQIPS